MSKKSRAAEEQLRVANERLAAQQHMLDLQALGNPLAESYTAATPPPPHAPIQEKKGLRKFSWFIIFVNVVFLVFVIAGIASDKTGTNCGTLDQETCDAATGIGATIGIGLIFGIWVFVDFILLVLWLVTRPRQR